jgi:uncharacterized protein (TIGR02145 family)
MRKIRVTFIFMLLSGIGLLSVEAQVSVKDIDGNVYKTITIGKQVWMSENLKTTKYRNGDVIGTTGTASQDIRLLIFPKSQWAYNGKESNSDIYGRLYTWYAATDSRGVCPVGWHVPTDAEWSTLITFLGGEELAYGKLKEADEIHWLKYDTGTNETGFTALPGGLRNSRGPFDDLGTSGYWWSSSEGSTSEGWCQIMNNTPGSLNKNLFLKRNGLSIRCLMTTY